MVINDQVDLNSTPDQIFERLNRARFIHVQHRPPSKTDWTNERKVKLNDDIHLDDDESKGGNTNTNKQLQNLIFLTLITFWCSS